MADHLPFSNTPRRHEVSQLNMVPWPFSKFFTDMSQPTNNDDDHHLGLDLDELEETEFEDFDLTLDQSTPNILSPSSPTLDYDDLDPKLDVLDEIEFMDFDASTLVQEYPRYDSTPPRYGVRMRSHAFRRSSALGSPRHDPTSSNRAVSTPKLNAWGQASDYEPTPPFYPPYSPEPNRANSPNHIRASANRSTPPGINPKSLQYSRTSPTGTHAPSVRTPPRNHSSRTSNRTLSPTSPNPTKLDANPTAHHSKNNNNNNAAPRRPFRPLKHPRVDPLRYANRLQRPRRLPNTPTKSHLPPSPRRRGPKNTHCMECGRAYPVQRDRWRAGGAPAGARASVSVSVSETSGVRRSGRERRRPARYM